MVPPGVGLGFFLVGSGIGVGVGILGVGSGRSPPDSALRLGAANIAKALAQVKSTAVEKTRLKRWKIVMGN